MIYDYGDDVKIAYVIVLCDEMTMAGWVKPVQRRRYHEAETMAAVLRHVADHVYAGFRRMVIRDVYFAPSMQGTIWILADGINNRGDDITAE